MNTILVYVRIHVIYRVNQAEYAIRIPMAPPQEYVNAYSPCRITTTAHLYLFMSISLFLSIFIYATRHLMAPWLTPTVDLCALTSTADLYLYMSIYIYLSMPMLDASKSLAAPARWPSTQRSAVRCHYYSTSLPIYVSLSFFLSLYISIHTCTHTHAHKHRYSTASATLCHRDALRARMCTL